MTGGENHLIMLDADGSIWTTGLNSNGQLGKNNTVNSAVPQQMLDANGNIIYGIKEVAGRGFERKIRYRKTRAGGNAQLLCCGVLGVHVCGRVPRPFDNGSSLGSLRQDSVRTDER